MPQKAASSRPGNGRALLASIPVLIILLPLVCYIARGVISLGGEPSGPLLERPEGEYCMEGTDPQYKRLDRQYMRYRHWEYLMELREEVVRYGNRTRGGLFTCHECHQSRERFCDRCHNAVSLKPDCFDCHDYPEPADLPRIGKVGE